MKAAEAVTLAGVKPGTRSIPFLPAIETVDSLPAEALPALVAGLAALQARAAARLAEHRADAASDAARHEATDGLLTIGEVASRLRVPKQHAYELARRELPAVRFGKYVRVRTADLETWIARHRE